MKKIILLTEKSVKAIFTGMFIFILLDVIFLSFQDYCDKQKFIMSNIGLIIITFVILATLTIVLYKKYNLIEMMLSRNWQIKITVTVIDNTNIYMQQDNIFYWLGCQKCIFKCAENS